MKHMIIVLPIVEPFRSYALPIDGGPRYVEVNLRIFLDTVLLGVGEKKFRKSVSAKASR